MSALDEAARRYLGVPFRHQGRNATVGIDCIGLLVLAAQDAGMDDEAAQDFNDYDRDPSRNLLDYHLSLIFGAKRPPSDLTVGDIAVIDFKGATRHAGIIGEYLAGGLSLIHTNSHVGCVTEARLDSRWLNRITGVYRP